ncbi:unnamed protein product [Plutella xylostella]|uniref:glycerol kinase n=1 Tax=Plutella xylostella TaxID=51655 RepID=A0A8S4EL42_PLUXY|nr:unnamed protein product [Plutella xylostella]
MGVRAVWRAEQPPLQIMQHVAATARQAVQQLQDKEATPQEGWAEQPPLQIMQHVAATARSAVEQLQDKGYTKEDIVALGITNQRETTIAWDKVTGEPLHPAIAWNDIRTDSTVDAILAKVPDRNKNYLKSVAGLPISPYFSALKMRWLKRISTLACDRGSYSSVDAILAKVPDRNKNYLKSVAGLPISPYFSALKMRSLKDNVKAVRKASRDRRLLFGTVDSWIVWNLTGGPNGGLHVTDATNASRTLLMNLETLNWDPMLCRLFGIHRDSLPQIRSSSEVYGVVKDGSVLDGIQICGILGNQQAALVGQNCLKAGQAKNTYRSGCFLLYNTGAKRVQSTHGLITTVAYKMGPDTPAVYALEGSIAVAGGAMKFLRDNLKLIKDITQDTEHLGGQVFSTGDVYFVPAFSGLYAPYWRKDARGIICGLTAFTKKHHIVRAALEAVCFQTRDILEAMNKDCGVPLAKLHVDGNMTSNELLMQLQADLIGIPVLRVGGQKQASSEFLELSGKWAARLLEAAGCNVTSNELLMQLQADLIGIPVLRANAWDMTALGVAMAAGNAAGVWSCADWQHRATHSHTFLPTTTDDDRDARYTKWKMAVQRSLGWATTKKSITMTEERYKLLASIPATLYVIGSFTMLVASNILKSS